MNALRIRKKNIPSLFIQPFLLCLTLAVMPSQPTGLDFGFVLTMTSITLIGVAFHLMENLQRNWLRIDTVFILGFLVVNFQWPLMYVISDFVPLYSFQANALLLYGNYSVFLSTIFLISWFVGFSINISLNSHRRVDAISGAHWLGVVFFVSLCAFSLLAGSSFFGQEIYIVGTDDISQTVEGVASYFFLTSEILAGLALSFLLYKRLVVRQSGMSGYSWLKPSIIALFSLLLIYCAIFLVGGERGQVVSVILGAALVFAAQVRSFRLWEFLVLMLLGFIVFSLIAILRATTDTSTIEFMATFGYWEISTNLAQSIVTVTQSVALIAERGDYFWGALWISQLLGMIPFLQGFVLSLSELSITDISSAMLITIYTFGNNPHFGLGTSLVADIYLNFGLFGLIFFPAMYGAVCRLMTFWLQGDHGFVRFFVAVIFGGLVLYITRSSLLFQLKPAIWGIGFLLLLVRIRRIKPCPPALAGCTSASFRLARRWIP